GEAPDGRIAAGEEALACGKVRLGRVGCRRARLRKPGGHPEARAGAKHDRMCSRQQPEELRREVRPHKTNLRTNVSSRKLPVRAEVMAVAWIEGVVVIVDAR